MRSYEAARGLFSLLSFICWSVIIAAFFGGFLSIVFLNEGVLGSTNPLLLIFVGIVAAAFALMGFFGLVFVQVSRAGVDSAEYAQQALQVSREQLELTRQSLHTNGNVAPSYADKVAKPASKSSTNAAHPALGVSYGDRGTQEKPV